MLLPPHPSAQTSLRLAEALIGITSAITSAEFLTMRSIFKPGQLASWEGTLLIWLRHLFRISRLEWLMSYPATVGLLVTIFLSSLALLASLAAAASALLTTPALGVFNAPSAWLGALAPAQSLATLSPLPALSVLIVATALFHLRARPALDAANQYSLMLLLVAVPAEYLRSNAAYTIALVFLAGMAALSYGTAGFLKLTRRGWFNGSYARYVVSTACFGDPALFRLYTLHPSLAQISGSVMVAGECLLAFAALTPPPACALLLGFGLLLHIGIARVLGLNTYVWAFAALYPATYFVSTQIYARL